MLGIEFQLTKMRNKITTIILSVAYIYLRWVYRVTERPRRSQDATVGRQNVDLNRYMDKGLSLERWAASNIGKDDFHPVTRTLLIFFVPMFYLLRLSSNVSRRETPSSDLGRISEYVYEGFTD